MENYTVSIEEMSSISKKLTFEIPYETFSQELDKKFDELKKTVTLKGFRKGKAPMNVIKKTFTDSVKEEVAEKLINSSYTNAISKNNLKPVSYPNISELKINLNEPISFEATIEIVPSIEVNVDDYSNLNIETFATTVNEEEVNNVVNSFLESKAQMKTLDINRATISGDFVNVDLQGFYDGVAKEDLKAISYITELGNDKGLVKELDDAIIGMTPGEEKDVDVKFADNYHSSEYASKNVKFNIKLNSIQERIVPVLTDEFVKELSQAAKDINTKDDYLKMIKENIEANKINAKDSDIRVKISEKLIDGKTFEVPEIEVQRKIPEIKDRAVKSTFSYYAQLPQYKDEIENFIKQNAEEFKKSAINEIRLSYILRSIAKSNNLNVVESEIQVEIEKTAKALNLTVEKFKADYSESFIREVVEMSLLEQKAFNFVKDKAIITEKQQSKE